MGAIGPLRRIYYAPEPIPVPEIAPAKREREEAPQKERELVPA